MLIFSLLHLYAFNSTPYHTSTHGDYVGGRFGIKAISAACNPLEIIQGIVQAVGYLTGARGGQSARYQDLGIEPLRHDEREAGGRGVSGWERGVPGESGPGYYRLSNPPPSYLYQDPVYASRACSPGDGRRS